MVATRIRICNANGVCFNVQNRFAARLIGTNEAGSVIALSLFACSVKMGCKVGLVVAALQLTAGQVNVGVDIDLQTAAGVAPTYLGSMGWEMWGMMGYLGALNDTRYIKAAAAMNPAIVRVGGITADWVRYVIDEAPATPVEVSSFPHSTAHRLEGNWPSAPHNLTMTDFKALLNFFNSSGLSFVFDLNELYGRNCNVTKPGCPTCTDW